MPIEPQTKKKVIITSSNSKARKVFESFDNHKIPRATKQVMIPRLLPVREKAAWTSVVVSSLPSHSLPALAAAAVARPAANKVKARTKMIVRGTFMLIAPELADGIIEPKT